MAEDPDGPFVHYPYHQVLCVFAADDGAAGDDADAEDRLLFFHPERPGDAEAQRRLTLFGAVDCFGFQIFNTIYHGPERPDMPLVPSVLRMEHGVLAMIGYGKFFIVVGGHADVPDYVMEMRLLTLTCTLIFYNGPLDQYFQRVSTEATQAALRAEIARMAREVLPLLEDTVQHENPFHLLDTVPCVQVTNSAFVLADLTLASLDVSDFEGGTCLYFDKSPICSHLEQPELLKMIANRILTSGGGVTHVHSIDNWNQTSPLLDPANSMDGWGFGETPTSVSRPASPTSVPVSFPTSGSGLSDDVATFSPRLSPCTDCIHHSASERTVFYPVWVNGRTYRSLVLRREQKNPDKPAMQGTAILSTAPGPYVHSVLTEMVHGACQGETVSPASASKYPPYLHEVQACGGRWLGLAVHTCDRLSVASLVHLHTLAADTFRDRFPAEAMGDPKLRQLEGMIQKELRRTHQQDEDYFPREASVLSQDMANEEIDWGLWYSEKDMEHLDQEHDFTDRTRVAPMLAGRPSDAYSVLFYDAVEQRAQSHGCLTRQFLDGLLRGQRLLDSDEPCGRLFLANHQRQVVFSRYVHGDIQHFHFRPSAASCLLNMVELQAREIMEHKPGKLLL